MTSESAASSNSAAPCAGAASSPSLAPIAPARPSISSTDGPRSVAPVQPLDPREFSPCGSNWSGRGQLGGVATGAAPAPRISGAALGRGRWRWGGRGRRGLGDVDRSDFGGSLCWAPALASLVAMTSWGLVAWFSFDAARRVRDEVKPQCVAASASCWRAKSCRWPPRFCVAAPWPFARRQKNAEPWSWPTWLEFVAVLPRRGPPRAGSWC